MIVFENDKKDRQVIPRWLPFETAKQVGFLESSAPVNTNLFKNFDYQEKFLLLKQDFNSVNASEAVGLALQYGDLQNFEAQKAARFVVNSIDSSLLSKKLASEFLQSVAGTHLTSSWDNIQGYRQKIKNLKQSLSKYPGNAIGWMDLAYYYVCQNQDAKARKCVLTALALSSSNRHILRSAVRFFVHQRESDIAHAILLKSSYRKIDPWIAASYVAVCDRFNFSYKDHKIINGLVERTDLRPLSTSELSSAIGTLELSSGAVKNAKRYFRKSLIHPTENALAQVETLNKTLKLDLSLARQSTTFNFEAVSHHLFHTQKYKDSLEAVWQWAHYQPFSSEPCILGSYITGVALEDYPQSAKFAEYGRISSPNSFTLTNNLAFAYANMGNILEAKSILQNVNVGDLSREQIATYLATQGLISFKTDNIEIGRNHYQEAINIFKSNKDVHSEALATYFWLKEEKKIQNLEKFEIVLKAAKDLVKKLNFKEINIHDL